MERTIQNLAKAFIGESMARNRYTMFASVARKEGYEQISEIFLITADNEREHASKLYKAMNELKAKAGISEIKVDSDIPVVYGTTAQNIKAAIEGETHEFTEMYPEFAAVADKEGLQDIAKRMRAIAIAEKHHAERYQKILTQLEKGTFFKKEKEMWWVCRECGYMHFGKEPPEKCPSCDHERAFYQLKCEEY